MKESTNVDRRAVLKAVGAGAAGSVGFAATAGASEDTPAPMPKVPPAEGRMWGSDGTNDWLFNDTGLRPQTAHAPFYVLDWIPAGSCTTEDNYYPPNHVAPSPDKQGGKRYNANWHVHFVTGAESDRPATPTPSEIENSGLTIIPLCYNTADSGPPVVPCSHPDAGGKVIFTCAVRPKGCPE